jgi:tetratricopeptide (TPR) repeat protein
MADDTPDGSTPGGPWGRGPTLGDFASAALDKARAFLEARNPNAAIREAEVVFSQDPNGPWGYAALDLIGDAETEKGDFDTVTKIGRELLSIDPDRLDGYIHLARGALEREDMRTCIQAIERGLERHPHAVSLILLNSIRFRQSHDYKRAVEWAEQAVAMAPWHPGALNTLGFALQSAERTEEAHRAFDEARQLDPTAAHSFRTAALVAYSENRFKDASADALKALEADPQDDECRRVLYRSRFFGNILMRPFWSMQALTKGQALAWAAGMLAVMIVLAPTGLSRFVFPAVAIYFLSALFVVLLIQAIDDRKRPQKPPTLKDY